MANGVRAASPLIGEAAPLNRNEKSSELTRELLKIAETRQKVSTCFSCICLPVGIPLCFGQGICCCLGNCLGCDDSHSAWECVYKCHKYVTETAFGERKPQNKMEMCHQAILPAPAFSMLCSSCCDSIDSSSFLLPPEREQMQMPGDQEGG